MLCCFFSVAVRIAFERFNATFKNSDVKPHFSDLKHLYH